MFFAFQWQFKNENFIAILSTFHFNDLIFNREKRSFEKHFDCIFNDLEHFLKKVLFDIDSWSSN